jgi:hypothetical protein
MNRQQQIELFLRLAHRTALRRLRAQPDRRQEALERLRRFASRPGAEHSAPYYRRWEDLLRGDIGDLEAMIESSDEQATVLRSMSPLGFLLTQHERAQLLAQARHTA